MKVVFPRGLSNINVLSGFEETCPTKILSVFLEKGKWIYIVLLVS